MQIEISHWLPIPTYCPVNNKLDWLYVTATYVIDYRPPRDLRYADNLSFPELYSIRRRIKELLHGKTIFMEDAAALVMQDLGCQLVEVALMFRRHVVTMYGSERSA